MNKTTADKSPDKVSKFHLKIYYYSVELTGLIAPIVVGILALLFPEHLTWITVGYPPSFMIVMLLSYGLIVAVLLLLREITQKDIFFNINRYLFVVLFILVIIMTGGVNSSFTFLLIFPFIASIVYLDQRLTRNIGIFLTILYFCIIFAYPVSNLDFNLVSKHLVQTALIATVAFLMYRIVVETLHQKYESEDRARRLAEFIHMDKLKDDFLSVAEHRLRTPLSGVRWALETLEEDTHLSESSGTLINDSLNRVKDAIVILNEMLTTAEDSEGSSLALSYGPVDLSSMIREIVQELDFLKTKNNNKVFINLPERLDIKADHKKLYAALSNVVDNACRYTKKGTVSLTLVADGKSALLTVKDDGIGIDPNELPYIFDRMHRGRNAVMVEPDESGIGLYVTRKVVELHQGTIKVESKLNEGTLVTITLPINPSEV